jgi:hypothetical protein
MYLQNVLEQILDGEIPDSPDDEKSADEGKNANDTNRQQSHPGNGSYAESDDSNEDLLGYDDEDQWFDGSD